MVLDYVPLLVTCRCRACAYVKKIGMDRNNTGNTLAWCPECDAERLFLKEDTGNDHYHGKAVVQSD